jgi:hypothetical protein
VTIKLAIVVVLTGAVLFVLVPALGATAEAVTGTHEISPAERLPLLIAPAAASTLLLVAVALAVFKPGWRLRSSGAAAANAWLRGSFRSRS